MADKKIKKADDLKFTPGPWRVEHSTDQMSFDDTTVCVLSYNEIINGFHMVASPADEHGDEAATARLIAAAPEMYEELKSLYIAYGHESTKIILDKINPQS